MEGDGVRWGSEPPSGPGPGGGGMIRDLCRSFGRYRRYLGRLRQNLSDTQKFFRDIKGSHSLSCPSSPTGGCGAQRAPAGDVAETGLQAGKEGRTGELEGGPHPCPAKQPREEVEMGEGPGLRASAGQIQMPWEGISPGVGSS